MPSLGKPNELNKKFSQISIKNKIDVTSNSKANELNRLAGNSDTAGGRFVDGKKHNKLGKNDFFKIMTHQLSLQDPSSPMDQKQFAAELAQFSALEQMTNMNKKLEQMVDGKPDEIKINAANVLGKLAVTNGTTVNYKGNDVEIPFYLPKDASNCMVRIFDSKGQIVRQLQHENVPKGDHTMIWDGKANNGYKTANDIYTVEILGWDKTLAKFSGETKVVGKVTSVNFRDGETILEIDGKKRIFLRDVESFKVLEQNNKQNANALAKKMNQQEAVQAYNSMGKNQ
ncbi:MAG: hypothetical protein KAQ98_03025 [Bacteriovoracaceae bacterium]|nr:hypothetical protein [Bacteriovoracaceae bacterium]